MRRLLVAFLLVPLWLPHPAGGIGPPVTNPPGTTRNFGLVGHDPLFGRGMNAALAIFEDFAYVGNRTDGSDVCVPETGEPSFDDTGCPRTHPGILVVDISDPADPHVVNEIGPPLAGNVAETSRELRVWPDERLLIAMNFRCSRFYHACAAGDPAPEIRFFDLTDPADPQLISTYEPPTRPHEMFLWVDPNDPERALLYLSMYFDAVDDPAVPDLLVVDISQAREGAFEEIAGFDTHQLYSDEDFLLYSIALHGVAVSPDGTRGYLAFAGGTYLEVDTSEVAAGVPAPEIHLLTPVENRPRWDSPFTHSAVTVLGRRPLVLVTDEVYGLYDAVFDTPGYTSGCPGGWVRLIDSTDPAHPVVVDEYRALQNRDAYCRTPAGRDPDNVTFTTYTAHNPTVLPNLAFVSWHSSGLHAIHINRGRAKLTSAGVFVPEPLGSVEMEDPAVSRGLNKVVLWSYPIIHRGLIYVVDIRNGLYVLRYTGPRAADVAAVEFLEGNSNLGDALRLDQP